MCVFGCIAIGLWLQRILAHQDREGLVGHTSHETRKQRMRETRNRGQV